MIYIKNKREKGFSSSISHINPFTNREREILKLLAEGKSSKQIANELKIETSTVEAHKRNMRKNLKLDIIPMVLYAVQNGYINVNIKLPDKRQ